MNKQIDVLVAAGMIDRKLSSKLQPLVHSEKIKKIYLIRRQNFADNKIVCFYPKGIWTKSKILSDLFRIWKMLYVILWKRPNLLISIGMIPHGVYITMLGKVFRTKIMILIMGKNCLYLTYPKKRIRQRFFLKIASMSDMIGTRGENSRAWLIQKGISKDKIFIPNNVFDFSDFKPKETKKEFDLIYTGFINYYKRIDLLLNVVHKLVYSYSLTDIKVALIGGGRIRDEIIRYSNKLGLEENVTFFPPGDKEFIVDLLNKSKVFVMTSQGEGLPMSAVEALSCGLPSVLFDDADISDIVKHNINGLLCTLADTDAFAKNVYSLLSNQKLYQELRKNALKIRQEKEYDYSLEGITEVWEHTLNKLID